MSQTALFTPADLGGWLRQNVSDDAASVVEKVVWGWLRPILGLTERPADPSPELVAWAIELGAIAYTNPEGLDEYSLENETSKYSGERRREILDDVASGGSTPVGSPATPLSSFPAAQCYPDPARPGPWGRAW